MKEDPNRRCSYDVKNEHPQDFPESHGQDPIERPKTHTLTRTYNTRGSKSTAHVQLMKPERRKRPSGNTETEIAPGEIDVAPFISSSQT